MGNGAGHGGPANGPGWGGPAKGAGGRARLVPGAATVQAREIAAARAERMLEILTEIAESGQHDNSRVAAASALLDRLMGKPVQTQVSVDGGALGDWTDDELRQAADALRARLAESDRSGDGPPEGGAPPH